MVSLFIAVSIGLLCLVSSRLTLSSSLLELISLGSNDGFSRGSGNSGSFAEVLEGLSVSGASKEDDVLAAGSVDSELIEGGNKTSGSGDSSSSLLGEFKSADSQLGDLE